MKNKTVLDIEIIRYILVGVVSVGIDTLLYTCLVWVGMVDPSWAKRISFSAGAVWGFFANKLFTFRKRKVNISEPLLFIALYLSNFVLNSVIHDLLFNLFNIKTLAFIVATFVSIVWNYVGQKWLVFRAKK